MRSSAIIDITTRSGVFDNSGSVAVYGGSRDTRRTSFEYGTFNAGRAVQNFVKAPFEAPWTWAGFFLGANAGYNRGLSKTHAQFSDETGTTLGSGDATNLIKSPVLGVQAGYNWQLGMWLGCATSISR